MKLADLIDADVQCPPTQRRTGEVVKLLPGGVLPPAHDAPSRFARRVFGFLVTRKRELGIAQVLWFKNQLVDGALVLSDGRTVFLEIKYRLGWLKACQAEWQVRTFRRSVKGRPYRAASGIVVFEAFQGDWTDKLGDDERGWRNWYRDHCGADFRIVLVRFKAGRLEGAR